VTGQLVPFLWKFSPKKQSFLIGRDTMGAGCMQDGGFVYREHVSSLGTWLSVIPWVMHEWFIWPDKRSDSELLVPGVTGSFQEKKWKTSFM